MGKEKNKRFERFFDYDCLPCGYSKPCDSYRFSEDAVNLLIDRIDQQNARIKELKDENGYIIFADGYDDNGIEVNKQVYTTYKSKCDELIQENQQLKQQLLDEERAHDLCIDSFNEECEKLRKQIKFESEARERFKQSQNQKAIEELKKIKNYFLNTEDWLVDSCAIEEFIINQLKELESENESKNL